MSTSGRKKAGRILFLIIFLLALLAIGVLGFLLWQEGKTGEKLTEQKLRNEQLTEQVQFFEKQAQIDSLLLLGKTEEALELYREQLTRADSATRDFAETRLHIAKELFQQQKATTANYNIELRETEEKLNELQDSLELLADEKIRERDSLARVITSSMQQLTSLQRELAEKAAHNFLTFKSSKGNQVFYIGEVKNDQAHGHGIGIWLTGSKYEGEWKQNQRHGKGVFEWADGERYEGEYVNDMRHGEGTYYWTNGQKYVGEWSDDQRNGKGIFYDEDGEILTQGRWKNDELIETAENN